MEKEFKKMSENEKRLYFIRQDKKRKRNIKNKEEPLRKCMNNRSCDE